MFAIIVTEKGGDQRRLEFDKSEVTIGRVQGNDIVLPKGNVSKRHARIVLKDGKFIIVDLKSTNGTYVNGRKITSPLVVKDNDKIYIGDFILGVDGAGAGRPGSAGMDAGAPFGGPPPPADPLPAGPPSARPAPPAPAPPPAMTPPSPAPMPPLPSPAPMPSPRMAPPTQRPIAAQGVPTMVPDIGSQPAPMPGPPPPAPPAPMPSAMPAPQITAPRPNRPPAPAPAPAPAPRLAPQPAPAMTPKLTARDLTQSRLTGTGAARPAPVRPTAPTATRNVQIEPLDSKVVRMLELQDQILDRLIPRLDLDNVPLDRLGDEALWQKAESAIVDLVETLDSSGELPGFIDQDMLIKEALNEALGLGPLEDLLADDSVEEIVVDRRDRILVSRGGALSGSSKAFSSDDSFRRVIDRLVAPTGHSISDASPVIDIRLRDGSRLAAAIPPVAVRGACLSLRKPRASTYVLGDLVANGCMSAQMADFLTMCVSARRNVLVCGAPGSGKSMILAAMANAAAPGERIVSVEEVAEIALDRDEWIALEARPADGNGAAEVSLGTVLHSALRMRADRLVVGDVRGAEALDLVSALSSACDGSLVAMAGDGPQAALARLAAMARLAAPGSATEAVRELVACAVDVVVHVARYADGVVRVVSISEAAGVREGGFNLHELFMFRGAGPDGGFQASGAIPGFYGDLEARGVPADTSIFRV